MMDKIINVINIGSSTFKRDSLRYDFEDKIFPLIYGYEKYPTFALSQYKKCLLKYHQPYCIYHVNYPIERGFCKGRDNMEILWDYLFKDRDFFFKTEETYLITEKTGISAQDRKLTIEILFEQYNIDGLSFVNEEYLSLIASNRSTGVVLDSGGGVTTIVPFYQGKKQKKGIRRLSVGGRDITDFLYEMIYDYDYQNESYLNKGDVCSIKEKYGYVALDYEKELLKSKSNSIINIKYAIPLKLCDEHFSCAEILFNPEKFNYSHMGIDKALYDSVINCNPEMQNSLFSNIIPVGGNAKLKGFIERLDKEITKVKPSAKVINLQNKCDLQMIALEAGVDFAKGPDFHERVVTLNEYNEAGYKIFDRKCPIDS